VLYYKSKEGGRQEHFWLIYCLREESGVKRSIKKGHTIMKQTREVGVAIHDRFFTLDVGIDDEELTMSLLAGLALYVRKGNSIKVRQSYVTFSGSQEIITKFISKTEQVGEWSKETKQILSALKKKR
jgi:hypothetical protein